MKASITNVRISPKKANLVAGLVRGKKAQDALDQLKFTPKKGADILYKLIHSAVANAESQKQKPENLFVKTLIVNKGITYKRGIPVSRGRYHPLKKRNSNIRVEMGVLTDSPASTKKAAAKKDDKAAKTEDKPKSATKKAEAPKKEASKAKETTAKKAAPKAKKETPKKDS